MNTSQNSIWPNPDGELGKIKIGMPDGHEKSWPEGDTLLNNCVYKEGKLTGFIDNKSLINNISKTTTFPYRYVDISLDKSLKATLTVNENPDCECKIINYTNLFVPENYKRLEYLESTGNQFINTGWVPNNETGLYGRWQPTASCNGHVLACSEENSLLKMFTLTRLSPQASNGVGFGQWFAPNANNCQIDSINEAETNFMNKRTFWVTNTVSPNLNFHRDLFSLTAEKERVENLYYTPTRPLYMFASNYGGRSAYHLIGRIFDAQISYNDTVVHYFIPALDETGTPCMYDAITREPFYEENGNQFNYPGMESQVMTLDMNDKIYVKKTKHGIRRLYHVPVNYKGTKDDYANENGFKELVELPMPMEGTWDPVWTETDTQLICSWTEVENFSTNLFE